MSIRGSVVPGGGGGVGVPEPGGGGGDWSPPPDGGGGDGCGWGCGFGSGGGPTTGLPVGSQLTIGGTGVHGRSPIKPAGRALADAFACPEYRRPTAVTNSPNAFALG